MLNVSRTTIYNRRKDFLDYAEREGISMAAKEYDVEETFVELSNLAHELKQKGLSIEEAKKGSEIISLLDTLKVRNSEIFIKNIIQKAQENEISGEDLIKYAIELRELEEQENKTYYQLISEIQDRKQEYEDIEDNIKALKEKTTQIEDELEQKKEEYETTTEKLITFVNTRNNLTELGIDIEDIENLEHLVSNFKRYNFDADDIIEFFKALNLSKDSLERNVRENERLEERNNVLSQEIKNLEKELEKNLAMTSAVHNLLGAKISPDDILAITQTVFDMTQILDLSEKEALNRFIIDVKTQYTERSNYTFQLDELKRLHKALQEKVSLIKEQIEVLEEVLDDRKHAVESLKRLEALEIDDHEFVEWGNLLKDLDFDIFTFRSIISKLGGIPEFIEKKTDEISRLEAKEKELQASVESLEERLGANQETLDVAYKNIESETQKIREAVETFEEYFTSPETGFKVRSSRIIDDVVENLTNILVETKSGWDTDLEHLRENMEKTVDETNRILENAYKGGKIVGRFHALEPIHKILRDDPVSLTEGTIAVITMLTYIKIWLEKKYPKKVDENITGVIEKLTEGLGDIY
jgi:predicted  nucleic acid-binding Zn-ribbon protein